MRFTALRRRAARAAHGHDGVHPNDGAGAQEEPRPRRGLVLVLALAAALIVAAMSALVAGAADRDEPQFASDKATGKIVRELPSLRTANSRTYETDENLQVARVYPTAVNFKDAQGGWKPIDERLVADGDELRSAANGFAIELPKQLGGAPARVRDGAAGIAFSLRGAKGAAQVDGATARYPDALPGVTLEWVSRANSLKETLELAGRDSAREFVFDLDVTAGLTPRLRSSGAIEVQDADGTTQMTVAAPWMQDAAGERSHDVAYTLDNIAGAWRLTLRAKDAWLDDPGRVWPVRVDPTVSPGPAADCLLHGGSPDANFCGQDLLEVGHGHSPMHDHRTLMFFDVRGALPDDAEILSSDMNLFVDQMTGTAHRLIKAHPVSRTWNAATVTWNRAEGTTPWATAGGDFTASVEAESNPSIGPDAFSSAGKYATWAMTKLTREWVGGQRVNHGVLLKDDGQLIDNVIEFSSAEAATNKPYLEIAYTQRIGERRGHRFEQLRLSDRISAKVNVAGGNLLVRQTDLTIPGGIGPDLTVGRSYNSQALTTDAYGVGWTMDVANDFRLYARPNQDAVVTLPSGTKVNFLRDGAFNSGKFITPPGYDATMTKTTGGWRLTEHASQTKHDFDSLGRHIATEDRNGRKVTMTYRSLSEGRDVRTITNALGGQSTVSYTTGGRVSGMTDPASRTWSYGYRADGAFMADFTDPDGKITRYEYTGEPQLMTKLITPAGRETRFGYFPTGDPNAGRIKSITRVTPSTTDIDPKTGFAYTLASDGRGETSVTDANNNTTRYVFDEQGRVTETYDGLGRKQTQYYTSNSNVEWYTSAANAGTTVSTRLQYDGDGNLFQSDTPTGSSTLTAKATYGVTTSTGGSISGGKYLPKTATNEQNRTRQFAYDANGNPTSMKDEVSPVNGVAFKYDDPAAPGKLTSIADPLGRITLYEYADRGLLTRITPPLSTTSTNGETTIAYDTVGRPSTMTDGKNQTRTMTYDGLDRIKTITYSGGSTVSFEYDADGNMTRRVDPVGTTTNTWDALGRLDYETFPGGKSNDYAYDQVGNLRSFTDRSGTVQYRHNAANENTEVYEPGVTTPITLEYNKNGVRTSIARPNGVTTKVVPDGANRITEMTTTKAGVDHRAAEVPLHLPRPGQRQRHNAAVDVDRCGPQPAHALRVRRARPPQARSRGRHHHGRPGRQAAVYVGRRPGLLGVRPGPSRQPHQTDDHRLRRDQQHHDLHEQRGKPAQKHEHDDRLEHDDRQLRLRQERQPDLRARLHVDVQPSRSVRHDVRRHPSVPRRRAEPAGDRRRRVAAELGARRRRARHPDRAHQLRPRRSGRAAPAARPDPRVHPQRRARVDHRPGRQRRHRNRHLPLRPVRQPDGRRPRPEQRVLRLRRRLHRPEQARALRPALLRPAHRPLDPARPARPDRRPAPGQPLCVRRRRPRQRGRSERSSLH
jgi:YD repeat-containing protein